MGLLDQLANSKPIELLGLLCSKDTDRRANSVAHNQTALEQSGPSCSKLTMLLVNVSLKFQKF